MYEHTAGFPGCAVIGQHTEECRARKRQEMVDKGDAITREFWKSGRNCEEPDVSLKEEKW